MKILYAIQGTGNGHLSRARDIIPALQAKGQVDILISGMQNDVSLPYPVKYKCTGLSFVFGKKGGIDFFATFMKNYSWKFLQEVKTIPVQKYDLIINDFEPVTAWAAQLKKVPCIGLSHQSAVLAKGAPLPEHTDVMGSFILKNYAPATTAYGFHFAAFADNIFTPLIRKEIREIKVTNEGHYTVYLPSYDNGSLFNILSQMKKVKWEVFSKYCKVSFREKNITFRPINNEQFIKSMASSEGILCGAGFESPAEALFLKKKLMVIPMKSQYEQHCNAAALKSLGVPVIKMLKEKHLPKIKKWIKTPQDIPVAYPDETARIIDMIFEKHAQGEPSKYPAFPAFNLGTA